MNRLSIFPINERVCRLLDMMRNANALVWLRVVDGMKLSAPEIGPPPDTRSTPGDNHTRVMTASHPAAMKAASVFRSGTRHSAAHRKKL
jgi:hypothetical protein